MKKNILNKKQQNAILLITGLIFILVCSEITIRFTIGRGKRFYVLRDVSFKLPEVKTFNQKVNILCLGGSASNGMGLKSLEDRYSELLAKLFPDFKVINDSNTGVPLSEINFYLYSSLKVNKIEYCIIFSGNNEYLELLNRREHHNYSVFLLRYSLPKLFSIISNFSYLTHNIINKAYDIFIESKHPQRVPFAILKGGGKDSWPYLNKFYITIHNLFYQMRLLELRNIILANPKVNFIYIIPPINYAHNWDIMKKYDKLIEEMPEDVNSIRNLLEKYWIKRRFLITPKLQTLIKEKLKNIENLTIFDLDAYLLSQVKGNALDTQSFFLDYCHLNESGHGVIAEQVKEIINNKHRSGR
ncbi:MAG: hypothetical protein KJ915_08060 [Candidatus Omnitrophica bacterium]|nr:hypothetical protein [Candidatus Omnitrophota bacterium]